MNPTNGDANGSGLVPTVARHDPIVAEVPTKVPGDRENLWRLLLAFVRALPVVLGILTLFSLMHGVHPEPLGTDAPYHARMAWMMSVMGFSLDSFPWLPFTRLADSWVDHAFGWHLLIRPYIQSDPLIGGKVVAILQGTLLIYSLYAILRRVGAPLPLFLALLPLMGSGLWAFRILQFRPQPLALVLFLWGIVALQDGRWRLAFLLSFALTEIHHSFFFLILAALALPAMRAFILPGNREVGPGLRKAALGVFAGSLLGLILNPYFPRTFSFFLWHVSLALTGEPRGNEWQSYSSWNLIYLTAPILVLIGLALVNQLLASLKRKTSGVSVETLDWLGLFAGFLFLGLKSVRIVEYWVPLGLIGAGALLEPWGDRLRVFTRKGTDPSPIRELVLGFLLGLFLGLVGSRYLRPMLDEVAKFPRTDLAPIIAYLKGNVRRGEIVYHSAWHDFPALFYADIEHRYVSGLDPAFLASSRPTLERARTLMNQGKVSAPSFLIREDFEASHALLSRQHPELIRRAQADPLMEPVVETPHHILMRIRSRPVLPLRVPGAWLRGAMARSAPVEVDGQGVRFRPGATTLLLPVPAPEAGLLRVEVHLEVPPDMRLRVRLGDEIRDTQDRPAPRPGVDPSAPATAPAAGPGPSPAPAPASRGEVRLAFDVPVEQPGLLEMEIEAVEGVISSSEVRVREIRIDRHHESRPDTPPHPGRPAAENNSGG